MIMTTMTTLGSKSILTSTMAAVTVTVAITITIAMTTTLLLFAMPTNAFVVPSFTTSFDGHRRFDKNLQILRNPGIKKMKNSNVLFYTNNMNMTMDMAMDMAIDMNMSMNTTMNMDNTNMNQIQMDFQNSKKASSSSSSSSPKKQRSRSRSVTSYSGEESRKYLRTESVYTHDDWVKHRSPDRFLRNILSTTASSVYKNVQREVMIVTAISTFCMLWNTILFGQSYTDFQGNEHASIFANSHSSFFSFSVMSLPLTPFTLASSSLGLLLTFRTNTAYQRWDEARKNWGMTINHSRDLVRMGNAYYDHTQKKVASDNNDDDNNNNNNNNDYNDIRKADLEHLSRCTWAFVRSMKRHLSPNDDEEDFAKELLQRLPKSQAEAILHSIHRPNRALFDLSMAIEHLPIHFLRKNEMHKSLTIFGDNLGSNERLLTSPVPLFYSRHTIRFLGFWLLFIPFALFEPFADTWNHIGMIPASTFLAVFLFGTKELATQMEEPFTILPMQIFCDKIATWCDEIISWEDGDNGITTRSTRSSSGITAPSSSSFHYNNDGIDDDQFLVDFRNDSMSRDESISKKQPDDDKVTAAACMVLSTFTIINIADLLLVSKSQDDVKSNNGTTVKCDSFVEN